MKRPVINHRLKMAFHCVKTSSTNFLLSISLIYLNISLPLVEGAILIFDKPPPTNSKPFSTSLSYNVSVPVNAPTNAPTRCTDSTNYIKPSFIQEDCIAVVHNEFGQDVRKYGEVKLEFVELGTDPSGRLPFIQTPRKYRYRSCVMAIVMNELFLPGEVPGTGPGPFPTRDLSTLREAFTAATDTLYGCVQGNGEAGWSDIGKL